MKFDNKQHYVITKVKTGNPGRIPDDYWVVGALSKKPEVGERLFMWRLANKENPEGKLGYFSTSMVEKIDKKKNFWLIRTLNSVYRLEEYRDKE